MPVGVQIPPHKELATEYGVSVITINKALSGLVSEGLLHSHVGRGTYVMVRPASTSGIACADDDRLRSPGSEQPVLFARRARSAATC